MEVRNNLSQPIEMEFDTGNVVIPAGGAVRIHIGLLAEPRISFEPTGGDGCKLQIHWGTNPVTVEHLPKEA